MEEDVSAYSFKGKCHPRRPYYQQHGFGSEDAASKALMFPVAAMT